MIVSSSVLGRLILAAAVCSASAGLAHDAGHGRHTDQKPSAPEYGQPGIAGAPSRRIEVVASETDGGMRFSPERLDLRAGEQVEFVVRNEGLLPHEFVIGTAAANLAHARVMAADPDMEHEDPNAVQVAPGGTARLLWKFGTAGRLEFACLIPGHYEAGMKGEAQVR